MRQIDTIREFFTTHKYKAYSPSQVWGIAFAGTLLPLTSVRRGISNLEEQGILEKLPATRRGLYGRSEHFWTLKTT